MMASNNFLFGDKLLLNMLHATIQKVSINSTVFPFQKFWKSFEKIPFNIFQEREIPTEKLTVDFDKFNASLSATGLIWACKTSELY